MYRCERCDTGYNPTVASTSEHCPRCKAQGVEAPLSYRLFEQRARAVAAEPEQKEE